MLLVLKVGDTFKEVDTWQWWSWEGRPRSQLYGGSRRVAVASPRQLLQPCLILRHESNLSPVSMKMELSPSPSKNKWVLGKCINQEMALQVRKFYWTPTLVRGNQTPLHTMQEVEHINKNCLVDSEACRSHQTLLGCASCGCPSPNGKAYMCKIIHKIKRRVS